MSRKYFTVEIYNPSNHHSRLKNSNDRGQWLSKGKKTFLFIKRFCYVLAHRAWS